MSGGRPEFNRSTGGFCGSLYVFVVLSRHSNRHPILLYCAIMLNSRDHMGPRDSCGLARRTAAHNKCSRWVLTDGDARSGHAAQTFSKAHTSSPRFHQIGVRCVKAAIQFCSAVHCQATPTGCVLSPPQRSTIDSWHETEEFLR